MRRHKIIAVLATTLLAWACATTASQSVSPSSGQSWVATWGASATAPAPEGAAFNNQTLRLIVRTSIGGDELRLRFANTFGAKPLVIGSASVAQQTDGAAVVQGSLHPVKFAGQSSIVVAPGALVLSDPVTFAVSAHENLSVSVFISGDSGPVTSHPLAMQTSMVSGSGDFAMSADAAAFRTSIQTWPYLAEIDVRTKAPAHSLVTFGDSITDGYKSTVDANHRWPDYFSARLAGAGINVGVVNEGISGNRIWHDAAAARPEFGPNGLSRFQRDALDIVGVSHIVVLLGINDIGLSAVPHTPNEEVSADQIIAALKQFAARSHAQGTRIIGATLTPYAQAGYYSAQGEQIRVAVNNWIRGARDLDGVIDFDAAVRDPDQPSRFKVAYDSGDHLHPSDAGYEAMANSIDLSLFR